MIQASDRMIRDFKELKSAANSKSEEISSLQSKIVEAREDAQQANEQVLGLIY